MKRNGPRWQLIGVTVALKQDLIGNGEEVFKAGTIMRVGSEPLGQLAGDIFVLKAMNRPATLSTGLWRGIASVRRNQFDVKGFI